MRRSLRGLLDGAADVRVVGEAGDQAEAIRLVREHGPSVLVLDLRLRGGSSVETIARLREHTPGAPGAPRTRIVVTTMECSPAFAHRAFQAGASGFVIKDLADVELVEAVRSAARGERYAGPRIAHVLRPLLAAASL